MLSRYLCHLSVLLSILLVVISASVESDEPEEYFYIPNPYPSWGVQYPSHAEEPHRMKKWASSLRFGKRGPGWASQVRFG
ncbi:unnamed protein product [Bursaphelenchus xylophilus]|uniref:(pine wood nematode) hypothetical protein n=1 Tax=Bursaphelenchus xylophilus TaxID=6326 RepID=A0A1I7SMI4_BURXY|nr:unnamed protein product [Bursaphelenchus xylophilus]CAG9130230.1 unnamed protein product [Bursaphelenchus xylophilus]